ncbi:subclass B3 metallo-beta-lactamase [Phenylobacterium sp.]|uniref:subclass B3 metallo-beta-lactamase n=1 Tax=Phenylobacterium sp. TaxID=1871053 RepID=UPI002811AE9F|nr:subclass B3 metallo-beta-lactamase [Phenylobacterium sp.]
MPAAAQEAGNQPVKPFQIADGVWWVGASDVASYLIQSNKGLILIDGGYESTAPQILNNIRRLGFDPKQVKIILNSHAHLDHAGGIAALKAATGAKVLVSAEDGKLMARGGKGDFFLGDRYAYPPLKPDGSLRDGQKVKLGERTLTARLTPGHTRGCTTWTLPVTIAGQVRQAMILCSNSVLPGYRLTGQESYPGIAADYEKSYRFWRSAPCDVFLASHAQFFRAAEKAKSGEADAFVDPEGCKAFFERGYAAFRAELAKQQAAQR